MQTRVDAVPLNAAAMPGATADERPQFSVSVW